MKILTIVTLAGLLAGSTLTQASPITIPDYSFEGLTTTIASPSSLGVGIIGTNSGSIGAWSAYSGTSLGGLNSSIASGTTNSLGAPGGADGNYVVRVSLPVGAGATVDLRQSLATTFLANSTYTLSFEIDGGTTVSLLSGSSISLLSGSTSVASLSGTNFTALLDGNGDFQTLTLTYQTGNTPPGGNIGIDFNTASTAGAGGNIYLDNFQLDVVPIPEPGVYVLSGLGILLLVVRLRGRRVAGVKL